MNLDKFINWLSTKFERPFRIKEGTKYTKILTQYGTQISIYCFVDKEGNIFLPASYSRPAKHIRGNIANPEKYCDRYGIKYLNNKGELI